MYIVSKYKYCDLHYAAHNSFGENFAIVICIIQLMTFTAILWSLLFNSRICSDIF